MVRVDHIPVSGARALSATLAERFAASELGVLTAVDSIDYEPFTTDSPMHGLKWNRIDMYLYRDVGLDSLVEFFVLAGVPPSSHLIYTVKMHMAGSTLSEVARGAK